MNPRVKAVKPNPDHTITVLFTNGETRCFLGRIRRQNGRDFCPDTLYLDSVAAVQAFAAGSGCGGSDDSKGPPA